MRKYVDIILSQIADGDSRTRLVIADVGDFPIFSQNHKDKFINVGVSESNAIGIAAGMASEGLRVYVYGISSFFLYRAYEQLRFSVSNWNQNVTFIGVGFGWKYYSIGYGHFCPNDIALIQSLPNFKILTPFTINQLSEYLSETPESPQYLRITANIVSNDELVSDQCKQYVLISYGEMVKTTIAIYKEIAKSAPIGIVTLSTLNRDSVALLLSEFHNCIFIVIEDQSLGGGISEILIELDKPIGLHVHLPAKTDRVALSREILVQEYGFDKDTIITLINQLINQNENTISSARS